MMWAVYANRKFRMTDFYLLGLIILFLNPLNTYAQFARVIAPQHPLALRSNPSDTAAIITQLTHHQLVIIDSPDSSAWQWIADPTATYFGYAPAVQLQTLTDLPAFKISELKENRLQFTHQAMRLVITTERLHNPMNNPDFGSITQDGYTYVSTYRSKPFWGTDGDYPNSCYTQIEIYRHKKRFAVPASLISGLFNPNLQHTQVRYDEKNDIVYLYFINSDGAGGYVGAFVFQNDKWRVGYLGNPF